VAIAAGGATEEVWLSRGGSASFYEMSTPKGDLVVHFGNDERPLDFGLKLIRFDRTENPGGMGDAGYASTVRVLRDGKRVQDTVIAMNRPLQFNKYVFYQSSFDQQGGRPATVLSVSKDPGRTFKYAGSLVLCVGMAIVMIQQGRKMSRRGEQSAKAAPPLSPRFR
jgi:cytochrome c biogenesis protein ResB